MPRVVKTASLMVAVVGAGEDRTVGVRSRSLLEDHQHEYSPAEARTVALAMLSAATAIELGVDIGLPTLDGSASEDDVEQYLAEHHPLEQLPRVDVVLAGKVPGA